MQYTKYCTTYQQQSRISGHLLLEVDSVVVTCLDERLLVGTGGVVHHPPVDLAGDLDRVAQRQNLQEFPHRGLPLQVYAWWVNFTKG